MNDVPPGEAQTLPPKIGVIAPTFNRPDFTRLLVLQMANQTLPPHVVCVHQNGTPQSYQWTIVNQTQSKFLDSKSSIGSLKLNHYPHLIFVTEGLLQITLQVFYD